MKKVQSRSCFLLVSLLFFCAGMRLHGQVDVGFSRTQVIELEAGWNAVYLEVEPVETDPTALFAGSPIEIVASYFRPVTGMEFIDSPNEVISDRKGWNVWYAPERADALLTDLFAIQAHHAYLIHVEEAYTWELTGIPYFAKTKWHPNAHNLVGFFVDTATAPTVSNFFSGADAHAPIQIYRMIQGRWALIDQPESTLMEQGVAYWAYSEGASDFSGPLELEFSSSSSGGFVFTSNDTSETLIVKNTATYPLELTLTLEAGSTGQVPLAYEVLAINTDEKPMDNLVIPFQESLSIGPLEPGKSFALDLRMVQSDVSSPITISNLKIVTDAGQRADVPVVYIRSDLAAE
jgi:hypothetical protein